MNISNYLITDNASKPKDMNLYEHDYDNTKPHIFPWFTNWKACKSENSYWTNNSKANCCMQYNYINIAQ